MTDLIDALCDLEARAVLIKAAHHGLINTLECAMEICLCPEGRGFFAPHGCREPWQLTADRFPIPGREGGKYTIENVRLAHLKCNVSAGGKVGGAMGGPLGGRVVGPTTWKIVAAMRIRCKDCGMTSTPGAMGSHFKKTGHHQ